MKRLLVFVSQHLAGWFGAEPRETLSAYAGRLDRSGIHWPRHLIDYLLIEPGHCRKAHEKRQRMNQQPQPLMVPLTSEGVALILKGLGHLPINEAGQMFSDLSKMAADHFNPKAADGQS
jgi:hypothetical protein